ncbi:MAG: hypothetical protein JXR48_12100 [Candidatus Delongbacteria bacterium]|nr:hypothetical protein [Candidatus Delongbacteria bacterium]
MNETEFMLQQMERITGIKLERDENGRVNTTKFTEDYKKKYPLEFKQRFGDASPEDVIGMFFREMNN